jgi:hypothetical protein
MDYTGIFLDFSPEKFRPLIGEKKNKLKQKKNRI